MKSVSELTPPLTELSGSDHVVHPLCAGISIGSLLLNIIVGAILVVILIKIKQCVCLL